MYGVYILFLNEHNRVNDSNVPTRIILRQCLPCSKMQKILSVSHANVTMYSNTVLFAYSRWKAVHLVYRTASDNISK